ncbi:MAG: TetR/AcrR family transcriptional regulator [Deltaproteobacteria bacterium]|nr:TetR/AcrR family transcriptional regulator [Deltaproteobacteria bacterium]NNK42274.1 TetR/AcrR family transcriptional regulator [Myxococcales bacterium]
MMNHASTRRPQRRALETRARLIEAAIGEFAEKGFEGASTGEIASRAGVAQSAVPYHFGTKDLLWKAAGEGLFGLLRERLGARLAGLDGVDVLTTARLLLTEFVRFAAAHPELHRFMLQEGTGPSERLEWLVAKHVIPMASVLEGVFQGIESLGGPSPGPMTHVFYVLIGAVSTPYALAPQVRLATGEDPFSEDYIEAHTEMMLRLFIPSLPDSDG